MFSSGFLNVRISFFSLSFMILNEKLLGFGLSVGQYLVKSLILSTFHNIKNEQND